MKKIVSLLLTVALLATMLSIFSIPASAESPGVYGVTEVAPDDMNDLRYTGTCIAKSGTYTVEWFWSDDSQSVLIVDKDTNITVNDFFCCDGTVIVCGTLNIECADACNYGSIKVINGSGKFNGTITFGDEVEYIDHFYVDGKCIGCGHQCTHNSIICDTCGKDYTTTFVGSTLSEGNLVIIVGVASAVVFGLGGFFLGTKKKKKPALASGVAVENEEE